MLSSVIDPSLRASRNLLLGRGTLHASVIDPSLRASRMDAGGGSASGGGSRATTAGEGTGGTCPNPQSAIQKPQSEIQMDHGFFRNPTVDCMMRSRKTVGTAVSVCLRRSSRLAWQNRQPSCSAWKAT